MAAEVRLNGGDELAVAPFDHLGDIDLDPLDPTAAGRQLPHGSLKGTDEIRIALLDPGLWHGSKLLPRLGAIPSHAHHARSVIHRSSPPLRCLRIGRPAGALRCRRGAD